jgi:LacI family transcriptional regulator
MKIGKQISIKVVAKECGVSAITVSRALRGNGSVKESTRERIIAVAEKLGYLRAHRMGRPANLNEITSRKIELIIGTFGKGIAVFHTQLIAAIESQASSLGYDCVIKTCNGEYEQLLLLQEHLRHSKSSATILVGGFQSEHLKSFFELVPDAVLLDNPGSSIIDVPYAAFCFDNSEAARIAINHMLSLDRHKILLVAGLKDHFFSKEMEEGYRDCLNDKKISVDERLIINTDFTAEGACRAVSDLFDKNLDFDAVLTNDEMASGVYRSIFQRGLRIPEDIVVCGCDGLAIGEHLFPTLTTLSLDYWELAEKAINYLLDEKKRSSARYRLKLLPRLEARESTGAELKRIPSSK